MIKSEIQSRGKQPQYFIPIPKGIIDANFLQSNQTVLILTEEEQTRKLIDLNYILLELKKKQIKGINEDHTKYLLKFIVELRLDYILFESIEIEKWVCVVHDKIVVDFCNPESLTLLLNTFPIEKLRYNIYKDYYEQV